MNYLDMVLAEAADQIDYEKLEKKIDRSKKVRDIASGKVGKITVGAGAGVAAAGASSAVMLKKQAKKYTKLAEQTKNKEEKAKYVALAKKYNKLAIAAAGAAVTGAAAAGAVYPTKKISHSSYINNSRKHLNEAYLEGFYEALEDMGYDDYDYYDEDYDDYDYDDYDDETEAYLEGYYMAYLDNGYDI
jgi:hypothetical protein